MGSTADAEAQLAATLRSMKSLGCTQSDLNNFVAKNVVHQEIGVYGDDADLKTYSLSEAMRDRLIVHARQDAASAMIHADTCLQILSRIEKRLNDLYFLLLVLTAAIIYFCRRYLSAATALPGLAVPPSLLPECGLASPILVKVAEIHRLPKR